MTGLRKMVLFPILGIFLLASSCTAQNQSADSPETSKKDKAQSVDVRSSTHNNADSAFAHPAIDFTLQSTNDKKISLTDFLGNKIILMNFWATWCPYCVVEIPQLNKIETTLADQVKLLSIDILEEPEKVKGFTQKKGVKFDVLLDQQGEVARKYRVRGTPTNIVIDKKGNIVYYGYELKEANHVITSLLSQ